MFDSITLDDAFDILNLLFQKPASHTIGGWLVGLTIDCQKVVAFSFALEPGAELFDRDLSVLLALHYLVGLHLYSYLLKF
jgi:hypothetical protein